MVTQTILVGCANKEDTGISCNTGSMTASLRLTAFVDVQGINCLSLKQRKFRNTRKYIEESKTSNGRLRRWRYQCTQQVRQNSNDGILIHLFKRIIISTPTAFFHFINDIKSIKNQFNKVKVVKIKKMSVNLSYDIFFYVSQIQIACLSYVKHIIRMYNDNFISS